MKLTRRLDEESAALGRWLDDLERFLRDNEYVPLGEVDPLERALDASNVSGGRTTVDRSNRQFI